MYTIPVPQYLSQLRAAEDFAVKYYRRLEAAGFEFVGDCIETHTDEESKRVSDIFKELCKEKGLT